MQKLWVATVVVSALVTGGCGTSKEDPVREKTGTSRAAFCASGEYGGGFCPAECSAEECGIGSSSGGGTSSGGGGGGGGGGDESGTPCNQQQIDAAIAQCADYCRQNDYSPEYCSVAPGSRPWCMRSRGIDRCKVVNGTPTYHCVLDWSICP